jgi:cytidylate kinase
MDVSFADVLRDVQERDDHDTHRAVSPLRRAEDARVLDTTCLDLAESLEVLVSMIREGIPCDEQAEG